MVSVDGADRRDTVWALRTAGARRRGWDGAGLPRIRHHHQPRRGAQGASAPAGQGRRVPAAVPPRSTDRRKPVGAARRADPSLRRTRRAAVRRHAAHRGARPAVGTRRRRHHGTRTGNPHPGAGGRSAADRPCIRARPSRRQTVEHPHHAFGFRLPHRLRHRARRRPHVADECGQHHRHHRLHGARTVRARRRRRALRRLRVGVRALRVSGGAAGRTGQRCPAADRGASVRPRTTAVGRRSAAPFVR